MDVVEVCEDLLAERAGLFGALGGAEIDLDLPTPAEGWSVRDQLTHLAWFDEAATQSIVDPVAFRAHHAEVLRDVEEFVEGVRARNESRSAEDVLHWLDHAGRALLDAATAADPAVRVPWYGPDMTVVSSVTARIMETWAHGQDIRDALALPPSHRNLRHVAFIGWRALANSFRANGLPVPGAPVRLELGEVVLGPEDAADVVTGPLVDFCLLVTQRRHLDDTDLEGTGPIATAWLPIAQAFAGPPGAGRKPGQFR